MHDGRRKRVKKNPSFLGRDNKFRQCCGFGFSFNWMPSLLFSWVWDKNG
jgi:hypothetical protein